MKTKLLFLSLLFFSGFTVLATDRHVYSGNSIQTQVDACVSGDRVIIHTGTYSQVVSIVSKSGITITYAGDGEVIVQGNGTDGSTFYVENSSSIVISYLTIKNTRKQVWSTGITVIGSGSNIQILNNKLTDISYRSGSFDDTDNPDDHGAQYQGVNAISVVGDNGSSSYSSITIKDNEVSYCMTGWNEAIAIKGNVDGFTVENNKVHHITNIGIDAFGLGTYPAITTNNQARNGTIKNNEVYNCICNYTDNGAIYVDGGYSISVMNNKVYNNIYGITIGCENQMAKTDGATEYIEIRNNLVYNNRKAGIMVGTGGDDDNQQGITRYCKITGNTFVKDATGDQWAGEFMLQNANNIEFYNNIFYGSYARIGTVNNGTSSNTFGYNIFYSGSGVTVDFSKQTGTSTWTSQTLAQFKSDLNDNSSTSQDPVLVNATIASLDAHLQSTSPCINTGKPGFATISGEKDLDGQTRVYGTAVDIGVDEYGSSSDVAVTAVSVSPTAASIAVGATQQLTATITPSNATNQAKTWSSSNTGVATVNSSGLVTGVSAGTTTITVTTQDGSFTATSSITVSTTITINGNLSDWSAVSAIATASSQTSTSLKVYSNSTTLYFGIAGSGMSSTDYQIFINSDNNTATGYQDAAYTSSGADYMIENGTFYQSTGTAWGWNSASATISVSKNSSVTELSINRSAFASLNATIKVCYKDIVSWSAVSKLPASGTYASYSFSSGGRIASSSPVQEQQAFERTEQLTTLYPNPVTGSSFAVNYQVPVRSDVRCTVVDLNGRELYYQDLGSQEPGAYSHTVEASSMTKGLYLVKIQVGSLTQSFKIVRH